MSTYSTYLYKVTDYIPTHVNIQYRLIQSNSTTYQHTSTYSTDLYKVTDYIPPHINIQYILIQSNRLHTNTHQHTVQTYTK